VETPKGGLIKCHWGDYLHVAKGDVADFIDLKFKSDFKRLAAGVG